MTDAGLTTWYSQTSSNVETRDKRFKTIQHNNNNYKTEQETMKLNWAGFKEEQRAVNRYFFEELDFVYVKTIELAKQICT